MAGLLLALFPVLLMFDTRLAWIALGTAIVLLCKKRFRAARGVPRRSVEYDANI